MDTQKKEIVFYETSQGKAPFEEWLEGLRDRKARAVIRARLDIEIACKYWRSHKERK